MRVLSEEELNQAIDQVVDQLSALRAEKDWDDLTKEPRQYRMMKVLQQGGMMIGLPPAREWVEFLAAVHQFDRSMGKKGETWYENLANDVELPGKSEDES